MLEGVTVNCSGTFEAALRDRRGMTAGCGGVKRVLVTGAGGSLGAPVIRAFREMGWSVRTLSRSGLVVGRCFETGLTH